MMDNKVVSFLVYKKGVISHVIVFTIGCVIGAMLLARQPHSPVWTRRSNCEISFGQYKGPEYTTTDTVGTPKCLVESKFMKVQQHQVKMGHKIIKDWMWIDYHDRINVLVEAPRRKGHFLVFEQTKYALEARQSSAIVGGIVEPGEEPENAARREVSEEMKLTCRNFYLLGRFRTDVNRGVGWTNSFLATDCQSENSEKHTVRADEVGMADTEKQEMKVISLDELKESARNGRFLEIQWSATVALALLHPALSS